MKKIALLFLLLSIQLPSVAQAKVFCTTIYAIKYKDDVKKLPNDKVMHCSLSCWLALKCWDREVEAMGYLKEFGDWLGLGNPEKADIIANKRGIQISGWAQSRAQCTRSCKRIYVKKKTQR